MLELLVVVYLLSPVLDLQQVTNEAVSGAALNKVPLSGEESLRGEAAVLLQEVVQQRQLTLFSHLTKSEHRIIVPVRSSRQ